MPRYKQTVFVDANTEVQLRPAKGVNGRRNFLQFSNRSPVSVFYNEGTHADSSNGDEVQAGQSVIIDLGVPDGTLFLRGGTGGVAQQVNIVEGYPD